jgi:Divergent InlB B-repeat domain
MRSSRRTASAALCALALSLGTAAIAATAASSAQTPTTLAFNDLGPSTTGVHMLDGYGGFSWTTSNWHYMSLASNAGNTFLALSGTATSVHRQDGTDFYFNGADFWSRRGLDATGAFYFVLHRDGALVYDGRLDRDGRNRFTNVPTSFTANYTGPVDTVAVVFTQGKGDWDHLAMDNLRFTPAPVVVAPPTPVPAPNPAPAPAPDPSPGPVSYKLDVRTAGKGSVAISRTGTSFIAGTVLTLTATPAAGSPWVGWTGDVTSSSPTIVVVVNGPLNLQANFK